MKNIKIYEKNILSFNKKDIPKKDEKLENCTEYISSFDGCKLRVCVDTSINTIKIATTKCGNNFYKQGIMNAFCELIVGMPILEARDHGVLRLENMLRENIVHPIKGIIMPGNSCELFEIPTNLIRAIYNQYMEDQNYHPLVNAYRPKEIDVWKSLDIKEREKIVFEKIKNFCIENKINEYDVKLIADMRVEFATSHDTYSTLAKLLFDMETTIGKELGFSLEIMFAEKKDINKKRQ